jgi:hypothetical protein
MDEMQGYGRYAPPPEPTGSRGAGRVRALAGTVAVAFVVTLAVVIGQRLSDQAMAVLAGAVCGVGASIPTSLLIVWVARRRQEAQPTQPAPGVYPPVVVVQPPAQPGPPNLRHPGYLPPYPSAVPREFTVVGGEMEEVRYGSYQ